MTILDEILANKKRELAHIPVVEDTSLESSVCDFLSPFLQNHLGVIAEIKSKLPSEGLLVQAYQPMAIAKECIAGGADAFSIATDSIYYGGSIDDLRDVRRVTTKPILCKDFFLDVKQVRYARAAGADACLLIVSALSDDQLSELKAAIESLGMTALIEVHNHIELERAMRVSPKMILINNRKFSDFSVVSANSARICNDVPSHVCVISASGIVDPYVVCDFPDRIDGVLVGASLMRANDRIGFIRTLRGDL